MLKGVYSILHQEFGSCHYRVNTLYSQPEAEKRVDALCAAPVVVDLLPCVGFGLVLAGSQQEKGINREDNQLVDHKNGWEAP